MKNLDGKQLVCVKPLMWFELGWNKQAYSCCSGWINTPIGKLPEQGAREVWFGEQAREIRKSVLDGSFKYCNAELCPHLREVSGPVMYVPDAYVKRLEKEIDNPSLPKYLNCGYDSSCNLACPSCRTEVRMANKEERLANDKLFEEVLGELGEGLEFINITGSGDPFASRHFWHILTNGCLAEYPDLRIRLHTNGQLLDAKHWERLKPVHRQITDIEISFDGASKATFEENRYPANWEKQLENFAFVAGLRAAEEFNFLQTNFVVQENNWHEMIDFVHFCLEHNADSILFTSIGNWGTFSEQAYLNRAVHRPSHPKYQSLVELLQDPIFSHPKVSLGISENLNFVTQGVESKVQDPNKISVTQLDDAEDNIYLAGFLGMKKEPA